MNSKISQLSVDDLRTRVVIRKILLHFSNKGLHNASLVSKLWNSEARILMESRGKLIAVLNPRSPCQDLIALMSDLEGMNAATISLTGINVQLGCYNCLGCGPKEPSNTLRDPNYGAIIDRLKWRNLSLRLGNFNESSLDCPASLCLRRILEEKCEQLVKIALGLDGGALFIERAFQGCTFPRLKILTIGTRIAWELDFFKDLVRRAPRLQILYTSTMFLLEGNVLEGSSAVLVPSFELNPVYNELGVSAVDKIRLESLALEMVPVGKEVDVNRLNSIMPVMLKNSWNTLNSLWIQLIFTISLMKYGVKLVNVRKLDISLPTADFFDSYGPEILELVKAFNFNRILPNVSEVEIRMFPRSYLASDRKISGDFRRKFLEQVNTRMWEHTPDRALKVKHLLFKRVSLLGRKTVHFFAEMIPNIQRLAIEDCEDMEIPHDELVWELWADLREFSRVISQSTLRTRSTKSRRRRVLEV